MIQHSVDHNARHGYEHPDGKCDFGEAFVGIPAFCKGVLEDSDGEKRHQCGQNDMWNQNRKVRRLPTAAARKLLAVFSSVLPQLLVVQQVASQKRDGSDERRNHQIPVQDLVLVSDGDVSDQKKQTSDRIQSCVDGRQRLRPTWQLFVDECIMFSWR